MKILKASAYLTVAAIAASGACALPVSAASVIRQAETLDRGLAAVSSGNGIYLSWRLNADEDVYFGTAEENVTFNIYRDNELIGTAENSTNYTDTDGTAQSSYSVAPVYESGEGGKCTAVTAFSSGSNYFDIPLTLPEDETITASDGTSTTYSFAPTDCSAGDVDGDGEYEIIVKFVSHELDVGNAGYSGTVRFNAYKLDGTRLWENDINLGRNVFSSAHTAQFLVYDFDGDGKSEMICQSSLGSTDGNGKYTSAASSDSAISAYTDEENAEADYRASGNGRVTTGEEFLTVFDGETGEAIDTISYPTKRVSLISWGKNDGGNRCNRFLATVAYLDGEKPYAVYWRGYYDYGSGRTGIAGVGFDGKRLSVDYQFDTLASQPGYHSDIEDYSGQGNHSIVSADVDGDGRDEIISGSLCMEADGNNELMPKWCSWREHGDAHHIGDYDPTNPGLEYFSVHEHNGSSHGKTLDYGMTVYSAATGEELVHIGNTKDTGRGMMANVGAGGYYQINGAGTYISNGGTNFERANFSIGNNFRIFWDGDLYDELLNGTAITSWDGASMSNIFTADGCTSVNGTKATPSLQADLFGDWREEVVYPLSDNSALRVFMSTEPSEYKMKSLMYDSVYRCGVAAEQTCYNQPPHIGYYLDENSFHGKLTGIVADASNAKTEYYMGDKIDTDGLCVTAKYSNADDLEISDYGVAGFDTSASGEQTVTVNYLDFSDTYTVNVIAETGIRISGDFNVPAGGTLDKSKLKAELLYSDGTSKVITSYKISDIDALRAGTQKVCFTYEGTAETFKTEAEVNVTTGFIVDKNGTVTGYTGDETEATLINGISTDGSQVTVTGDKTAEVVTTSDNNVIYAAHYDTSGVLLNVSKTEATKSGTYNISGDFAIDRVFVWNERQRSTVGEAIACEVTAIADGALENSGLKRLYIYNDDIELSGDNIFPEGITLVCGKDSSAYNYATEHGIAYEIISAGDSITFDEDFYSAYAGKNMLMQSSSAAGSLKDEFVTYNTVKADSRGPWFSQNTYGFSIGTDSGNNYLSVNAGIYDNMNKFNQVYISLNEAKAIGESMGIGFDITFPSDSNSPYAELQTSDGTVIDTISVSGYGLENDVQYRYELSYDGSGYSVIITQDGSIVSEKTLTSSASGTALSCIAFKQGFSGGSSANGIIYLDNILIK